MGSFLEISKIAIATYLHDKWKETYGVLKIYLTIALIVLSIITSMGIYGLLSTGFQQNIAKLEINQKEVKNLEIKKTRFDEIKNELIKEKTTIDGDITKLREGLSNNTTIQSVDRRTGQVITKANNANRKSFENQLKEAQTRRDEISKKVDGYNDSITNIDIKILNMESEEVSSSELGSIKYLSELLDWSVKKTANLFILILIFVFDPLAITLVIATNQAFKSRRKNTSPDLLNGKGSDKKNTINLTNTQKTEKKVWKKVRELKEKGKLPSEQTEEEKLKEPTALAFTPYDIEEVLETPKEILFPEKLEQANEILEQTKENDEYFEMDPYYIMESPVQEINNISEKTMENKNNNEQEIVEEIKTNQFIDEGNDDNHDETTDEINDTKEEKISLTPKRLSYSNRNGGSLRINRI